MGTVRVNRNDRLRVWIEIANLGSVHRAGSTLADFDQTHLRAGIDHPGIDRKPSPVDRLCARGNLDIRTHGRDFSVANYDCAVFNVRSRTVTMRAFRIAYVARGGVTPCCTVGLPGCCAEGW